MIPCRVPNRAATEDFDDLSLDPASPSYFLKRVNGTNPVAGGNSSFVEFVEGANVPAAVAASRDPIGSTTVWTMTPSRPDFEEVRSRTRTNAPGSPRWRSIGTATSPSSTLPQRRPPSYRRSSRTARNSRFRFAVVDAEADEAQSDSLDPRTTLRDSQYAAFYYPWIFVSDPRSARGKIPPGGAVCGIYALTDNTTGVWKAPANEVVAGAIDVEYEVTTGAQEVLNPKGVNAIRRFPGRGIRVWGARTLVERPALEVRERQAPLHLPRGVDLLLDPVGGLRAERPRLWARVKQTITLFLRTQWREARCSAKEEEAFSVAVGQETMTEDDILNGRLIVEIGVAPVRPAEFVIFRVFQQTQEAT